jgi:glucosyl-3-phosphoglycerate synthase
VSDAALRWTRTRSFHHSRFPVERLVAERQATISLCLPAREEAATIGTIVGICMDLRERGAVDQVVVIDAASQDGTGNIAAALGAEVHQQSSLMPAFGEVHGKGDAMWRALSVLTGDVVCYLDADSEQFGPHFVTGIAGPLACEEGIQFVKGCYRRPFKINGTSSPFGGGRVTELTARPLLNLFYPELGGFRQPLAGEIGARRELFEKLPFSTGYAIEIAMMIDAWAQVGLWAMAEVDLDVRQNRHQSLSELGPMAYSVLMAVVERLRREGRLNGVEVGDFLASGTEGVEPMRIELMERPPMSSLKAPA